MQEYIKTLVRYNGQPIDWSFIDYSTSYRWEYGAYSSQTESSLNAILLKLHHVYALSRSPSWSSLYYTINNWYLSQILASRSCLLTFQKSLSEWKMQNMFVLYNKESNHRTSSINWTKSKPSQLISIALYTADSPATASTCILNQWAAFPSISRISRREICINCRSSSSSRRYIKCRFMSLGCADVCGLPGLVSVLGVAEI